MATTRPFQSLNQLEEYFLLGEKPELAKKAMADALDLTEFAHDPIHAATVELMMRTLDAFRSMALPPVKIWASAQIVAKLISMCQEGRPLDEICAHWHDAIIAEGIYELDEIRDLTRYITQALFKNYDLYTLLFKTQRGKDMQIETANVKIEQPRPAPPLSTAKEAIPSEKQADDEATEALDQEN